MKIFSALLITSALTAALTVSSTFLAPAAQAGFILGSCDVSDVTTFGSNANSCLNYAGNNDNYQEPGGYAGYENYIADDFSLAGAWSLLDADNEVDGGGQDGTWAVDSLLSPSLVTTPFVVTVKAANFFAAYLFDNSVGQDWAGSYDVDGATTKTNFGNPAGLSHISVYTLAGVSTPVPEPATMLLFGTGLIGLAGVARRKKK